MQSSRHGVPRLRLHLTNVTGLGAVQLVSSLLPAFETLERVTIDEIYVPATGALASYRRRSPGPAPSHYRRHLPNAVSRVLECTAFGSQFDGATPLLVLGDVPIRAKCRQTVFVQTPLITCPGGKPPDGDETKYRVARALLRTNVQRVSAFIVQTTAMAEALLATYRDVAGKVHVVQQPVPTWMAAVRDSRRGPATKRGTPMRLVYPAFDTPRKNHALMVQVRPDDASAWPVERMTFTIPPERNPNPALSWLECVGLQSSDGVLRLYESADALVYLSLGESYGFPLVEAMWVGLPIVSADRPYARALCGPEAIYFEPTDAHSLKNALIVLRQRLDSGWWPSWCDRLAALPSSWTGVAESMAQIACGP